MRIVLDTNVLVSGLLNPRGSPGRIVDLMLAGDVDLAVDDRILDEYLEVLSRREFGFEPKDIESLIAVIVATAVHVQAAPLENPLPDRDDEAFLEVALAAEVKALVTGNLRHFPAHLRCGVQVVSPAQFLASLPSKR